MWDGAGIQYWCWELLLEKQVCQLPSKFATQVFMLVSCGRRCSAIPFPGLDLSWTCHSLLWGLRTWVGGYMDTLTIDLLSLGLGYLMELLMGG